MAAAAAQVQLGSQCGETRHGGRSGQPDTIRLGERIDEIVADINHD